MCEHVLFDKNTPLTMGPNYNYAQRESRTGLKRQTITDGHFSSAKAPLENRVCIATRTSDTNHVEQLPAPAGREDSRRWHNTAGSINTTTAAR